MVKLAGTLVLVGAGKMGGAMLEGWLKGGAEASRIVALDPSPPPEVMALLERSGVRLNPEVGSIHDAEVVIMAVKPQLMEDVLPGVVPLKAAKPLILSVAAGKTIASFERHFGADAAIIRRRLWAAASPPWPPTPMCLPRNWRSPAAFSRRWARSSPSRTRR